MTHSSRKDDEEVERNQSFHNPHVWSAKLWRANYNFTSMTVQWEKPHNETITNNKLCAYKLHYYRGTSDLRGFLLWSCRM